MAEELSNSRTGQDTAALADVQPERSIGAGHAELEVRPERSV